MSERKPIIKVREENGIHKCDPTHTTVKPGDIVVWEAADRKDTLILFFPGDTPFEDHHPVHDGHGPIHDRQDFTVRKNVPHNTTFVPMIFLNGKVLKTEGDIQTNGR